MTCPFHLRTVCVTSVQRARAYFSSLWHTWARDGSTWGGRPGACVVSHTHRHRPYKWHWQHQRADEPTQHSTEQHGTALHGAARHGAAQCITLMSQHSVPVVGVVGPKRPSLVVLPACQ